MPTSGHCGQRGSHAAEHAISRLSTNDVAYHRFTRQAYKPWITPAVDIPQLSQEPVVLLGRLAKAITRIKNDAAPVDSRSQGRLDAPAQKTFHFDQDIVVARHLLHSLGLALHRSEEHTSELQSLMRISYAVFCLQKKNQKQK